MQRYKKIRTYANNEHIFFEKDRFYLSYNYTNCSLGACSFLLYPHPEDTLKIPRRYPEDSSYIISEYFKVIKHF